MPQVKDESNMGTDNKPILVLDFDGVCHQYTSGWKGAGVIPDPAVDGLFEFLESVKNDFDVQVFSSRTHQEGGAEAMLVWFMAQRKAWRERGGKPPEDTPLTISFPKEKPPAWIGIDDRVLLFNGKWPTLRALKDFKPWYKRNGEALFPEEALEEILSHVTACASHGDPPNGQWIRLRAMRGLGREQE
jgi:hypothetical protein